MTEKKKKELVENLADNLPVLRKKLGLTQKQLADMVGVSRPTIISIEKKKTMSWNMFLSILVIFLKNKETDRMLNILEIYTDDLNEFIKRREGETETEE